MGEMPDGSLDRKWWMNPVNLCRNVFFIWLFYLKSFSVHHPILNCIVDVHMCSVKAKQEQLAIQHRHLHLLVRNI